MDTTDRDEPLTPAGRLFVQPEMNQVINCVIGAKLPLDVPAIRSVVTNSLMIKQPRFSSLFVTDRHGREHWRKTQVDVDRHIIVHEEPVGDTDEEAINDYIADLTVSSPLSSDKPLWEIHLLLAHNCAVVRLHHALGDGISLMSLMLTLCRKVDDPSQMPTTHTPAASSSSSGSRSNAGMFWRVLKVVCFTVLYMVEFVMRSLWVRDKRTAVSGGAGVELWPRKLATAKFRIDDMRTVKSAVANATINDVLFAVISSGLSKYLEMRSPKALKEGTQFTGLAMVNLRPQAGLQDITELMRSNSGTRWGNRFGILLLPIYFHKGGSDSLEYVRRAKAMIDRKKMSLEAHFSYSVGHLVMSLLGPKFASWLNYRIISNTTFTISNVIGPKEEITIAGIPVDYIRTTSSSLPHAITVHMLSYAGKADMQIQVAKDIIPDPEVLAKFFEDSLLEMKDSALTAIKI